MKTTPVLLLAACFLFISLPALGEDSEIYGYKLLDPSMYSFQDSSIEFPVFGTKPSDEWLDLTGLRALASRQNYPVWLPDGQTIACTSIAAPPSIWLVPVDGGTPTRLYSAYYVYQGYYLRAAQIKLYDVTPDGKEIVFGTHIIDESRGTQVTLRFNSDGQLNGCHISNAVPVIQAVNIQTGAVRTIVEDASHGKYSRDGKYFVYSHMTYDGIMNEYSAVRDTETGCEWTIPWIWDFCFSADDAFIIYSDDGQLFRIPVTGGAPEQITFATDDSLTTMHLHPESSPDGRWILFSGNGGPRSNTIADSTGAHSYSTGSIPKLCAYNVYSGETLEFFPRPPAIATHSAKFSPDGARFCYMFEDKDQRHSSTEVYIYDFDCSTGKESVQTLVETTRPSDFALLGNYPNPFNPSTTIEFSLPEAGFADLIIYNVMGQKIRELISGMMTSGAHSIVWDGRDDRGLAVSAGVYVTRLRMNDTVATGRMTLVK